MPGDYSRIPSLVYGSVPSLWGRQSEKYYVASSLLVAVTVREHVRDGISVPGSVEFIHKVVAASDGPGGIQEGHGWSSLRVGHTQLEVVGSCPEALGPQKGWFGFGAVTQSMKDAARSHKIGPIIGVDYNDLKYPACIDYIKAHPGSTLLVNAYGRESYAVVGVDPNGLAWWVDPNRVGRPVVRTYSLVAGQQKFEALVTLGIRYGYGRDQYSLLVGA